MVELVDNPDRVSRAFLPRIGGVVIREEFLRGRGDQHDLRLREIIDMPLIGIAEYDAGRDHRAVVGIEIRGQSSQSFPMKSYSIELRDAAGNSQDKALFGLPKESDWVLYAPYTDKTLMRNFLAGR